MRLELVNAKEQEEQESEGVISFSPSTKLSFMPQCAFSHRQVLTKKTSKAFMLLLQGSSKLMDNVYMQLLHPASNCPSLLSSLVRDVGGQAPSQRKDKEGSQ